MHPLTLQPPLLLLLLLLVLLISLAKAAPEYQSYDGAGNNKDHPEWGAINSALDNSIGTQYADGSGDADPYPISIGVNDTALNPRGLRNAVLNFNRSQYLSVSATSGSRIFFNHVTPWIDGSSVYGYNSTIAASLRSGNDGLLKSVMTKAGEFPLKLANGYFAFGKDNANITPQIITIQILMMREHNRKAREIKAATPNLTDEEIFQKARRWVISAIQKITFDQYLPTILGSPLPPYAGYNASLPPLVETFFPAVALRYGHAAIGPYVLRVDANNEIADGGLLLTRKCFYLDGIMQTENDGIADVLRGMTKGKEKKVDGASVEDVRNFLVLDNERIDLPAFDVMRGRDWGIPNYNRCRQYYGLPAVPSFDALTNDTLVVSKLESLYNSIDDLDAIVGALVENHQENAAVGPLIAASIRSQFLNLRSADRFWYENPNVLTPEEKALVDRITLGELVKLNLGSEVSPSYPSNPFRIMAGNKEEKVNVVQSSDKALAITWKVRDGLVDFVVESNATNGWFAFGLGSDTMQRADVYFVTLDENGKNLTVYDAWSTRTAVVSKDTDRNCKSDVTNIKDITGSTKSKRAVSFTRPLKTGDSSDCDVEISQSNALDMIMAYHPDDYGWVHHGPATHFAIKSINFFADGVTSSAEKGLLSEEDLKGFHGLSMFLAFGVLYPVGIFVARYQLDIKNWVDTHAAIMGTVTSNVIMTAVTAIVGKFGSAEAFVHVRLAFATIALVLITTACGLFNAKLNHPSLVFYKKYIRPLHRIFGYSVYLLGLLTGAYGVNDIKSQYPKMPWLPYLYYATVLAVPIVLVIYGHIAQKMDTSEKNAKALRKKKSFTMDNIAELLGDNKKEGKLPWFTWEEIGVRIAAGAKWVVIDKQIYDVEKFIDLHPGGPEILKNHIGFDCTTIFKGTHGGEKPGGLWSPVSTLTTTLSRRNGRGGGHAHSRYAHFLLGDMAIGKLKPTTDMPSSNSTFFEMEPSDMNGLTSTPGVVGSAASLPWNLSGLLPNRFQTLVFERQELSTRANAVFPVYHFRLKFDRPEQRFIVRPGEAVLFRAINQKGETITRPYTPVQCDNVGGVDFFIKIYGGEMTSFLAETESVQVMGPYSNTDVLNKKTERGCWKTLGMVAGGTGLTAMLLLIDYHLRNAPRTPDGKPDLRMSLLICARTIADVFACDRLDQLIEQAQGCLTVRYCLNDMRGGTPKRRALSGETLGDMPSSPVSPTKSATAWPPVGVDPASPQDKAILERCMVGNVSPEKLALCMPPPPAKKKLSKWLTVSLHDGGGVSSVLNQRKLEENALAAEAGTAIVDDTNTEDTEDDMAIVVCGHFVKTPLFTFQKMGLPNNFNDIGFAGLAPELLDLLGEGGFGAVYHAKDQVFVDGPDAAVKVGRPECENSKVNPLLGEISFLSKADRYYRQHPEEARVLPRKLGNGEYLYKGRSGYKKHYYVAMELLGRSVYQIYISKPGHRLPRAMVARIGRCTIRALKITHGFGYVHRDIKPANICARELPGEPFEFVVVDVGGAWAFRAKDRFRHSTSLTWTPYYASIGAWVNQDLMPTDDLWSLLYTLLELLNGTLPWENVEDEEEILRLKLEHFWDPQRLIGPDYPELLEFHERLADLGRVELAQDQYQVFEDLLTRFLHRATGTQPMATSPTISTSAVVGASGGSPTTGPTSAGVCGALAPTTASKLQATSQKGKPHETKSTDAVVASSASKVLADDNTSATGAKASQAQAASTSIACHPDASKYRHGTRSKGLKVPVQEEEERPEAAGELCRHVDSETDQNSPEMAQEESTVAENPQEESVKALLPESAKPSAAKPVEAVTNNSEPRHATTPLTLQAVAVDSAVALTDTERQQAASPPVAMATDCLATAEAMSAESVSPGVAMRFEKWLRRWIERWAPKTCGDSAGTTQGSTAAECSEKWVKKLFSKVEKMTRTLGNKFKEWFEKWWAYFRASYTVVVV
ncbi:hypothetical protein HDU96_003150 [Phlyctochytrium bullatum]|nr:hypothetical protein HDU96_003150 [Phlyctochytrium bullatum]